MVANGGAEQIQPIRRQVAVKLIKAGVGEELVRLSIGLEDAQDLLDDLGQALAASQKG